MDRAEVTYKLRNGSTKLFECAHFLFFALSLYLLLCLQALQHLHRRGSWCTVELVLAGLWVGAGVGAYMDMSV